MRSAQGKDNLPLNSLYISQDLIKCHEENECPSFFSSAPFVVIFWEQGRGAYATHLFLFAGISSNYTPFAEFESEDT